MYEKLRSAIKPLFKTALVFGLIAALVLGNAQGALAARSGGRIGGGSFRAPSRTYTPSRPSVPPGGGYGYGYPGGGFGFPFLLPFFGFGGGFGGLFTILIFFAIANFLVQSFRRVGAGGDTGEMGYGASPTVAIAEVQVGLLAEARSLQDDLTRMAETADTGTEAGRAQVLQEATLSLLRHPEYWVYGAAQTQQARLEAAEAKFNQLALGERSKFTEETLSNVNNQLRQAAPTAALPEDRSAADLVANGPSEYIVVTILAAALGNLDVPAINNTQDLRRALSQIGGISSDRLLAIEILWTPQAKGDTLTTDDMLAEYPNLKLV